MANVEWQMADVNKGTRPPSFSFDFPHCTFEFAKEQCSMANGQW